MPVLKNTFPAMKKILVICGPTSTGKTSLALSLAKKLNGELISADSRQVYTGMDIGTGKDLPQGSVFKKVKNLGGYYEINGVKIWGYDILSPKKEFSVSHYINFAQKIIKHVSNLGKLPIIVGGTGLYIKGVIDGIETAIVPKNENLRKKLEPIPVDALYENLSQMDPVKSASMNASDRKNPRRLIRAIEVAQFFLGNKYPSQNRIVGEDFDVLFIGLTSEAQDLEKKIEKRVKERVGQGIKEEIKNLLKKGVTWEHQSMMGLGYRDYRDFFEGGIPEAQIIDEWTRGEKRYARRQMVWFKKDTRINWFDIKGSQYPKNVEELIKKWYK